MSDNMSDPAPTSTTENALTPVPTTAIVLRRPGRPRGLTPEVQASIVRFVRDGAYLTTAFAASGVDRSNVYRWLRRVDQGDPNAAEFIAFRDTLERAECAAEAEALRAIRTAKDDSWIGAARWLERRFPTRWGRRSRLAIPSLPKPSKPIADMSDDELVGYARELAEAEADATYDAE